MKILIAEDDTTSRLLFSATLRKLGYAVTAVENGQKAWEAWKQDEYPLLISDWMMPDIDGLQLCKMIRAEPRRFMQWHGYWTGQGAQCCKNRPIRNPQKSCKTLWIKWISDGYIGPSLPGNN